MNIFRTIGKVAVYIIFFAATWFLNFLICGLIGSVYYDGTNEVAGAVYGFTMIFIPPVASTLETITFRKKWNKRTEKPKQRVSKYSPINYIQGDRIEPVIDPVIAPQQQTVAPTTYQHEPTTEDVLLSIDQMEGHEFEYWCASLLSRIGFSEVEVTRGSGDQGVDIIAVKEGIRYAIQCKCYSKDLGNSPIQEVSAGKSMPMYRCQIGAVMTNRYFTKGAKDLAEATGTLLWDRDWIKSHLQNSDRSQTRKKEPAHSSTDSLLESIMEEVFASGQISTYQIQRRFNLDYHYATFVMNTLEESGFVVSTNNGTVWSANISHELWNAFKKSHSGTPTPKR